MSEQSTEGPITAHIDSRSASTAGSLAALPTNSALASDELLFDPLVAVESAKKNSKSTTTAFTDWKLTKVRKFRDNIESNEQQGVPDMKSVPDDFFKVFERRQLEFC